MSLIKEVFPAAEIAAEGGRCSTVTITNTATNTKIVTVPQRDLYRKYKWPAAPKVTAHLQAFKEEMDA